VQDDGVVYRVRRMQRTPFVLAIFTTLAFGAAIAVVHSRVALLFGAIAIANVLLWLYIAGPAASVTVRPDMLVISNSMVSYLVPRGRVVSIESVDTLGVRVRVKGDKLIWVGALSPGLHRFHTPSPRELLRRADRLGDAVFATPAPADIREVETRYRWANLLGICVGAVGIGLLFFVIPH
jgi:hypothetical protein